MAGAKRDSAYEEVQEDQCLLPLDKEFVDAVDVSRQRETSQALEPASRQILLLAARCSLNPQLHGEDYDLSQPLESKGGPEAPAKAKALRITSPSANAFERLRRVFLKRRADAFRVHIDDD